MSFWSDFNETRGNRPGHQKNDPEGQQTWSGPESRRNGRFYVRPKSGFWPKNGFYPKKSPKMTFFPLIIWAKGLFFFEQLFPEKNPADLSKSLPPSHLWEFRLPVTALALSARGPFGPARFARGLDYDGAGAGKSESFGGREG